MSSTRTCSARGCTRRIRHPELMCGPHWDMVPSQLQTEVAELWTQHKRTKSGGPLTEVGRQYHRAVQLAIAAVAEAELAEHRKKAARNGTVTDGTITRNYQ